MKKETKKQIEEILFVIVLILTFIGVTYLVRQYGWMLGAIPLNN